MPLICIGSNLTAQPYIDFIPQPFIRRNPTTATQHRNNYIPIQLINWSQTTSQNTWLLFGGIQNTISILFYLCSPGKLYVNLHYLLSPLNMSIQCTCMNKQWSSHGSQTSAPSILYFVPADHQTILCVFGISHLINLCWSDRYIQSHAVINVLWENVF